jgi:hypothetical protein
LLYWTYLKCSLWLNCYTFDRVLSPALYSLPEQTTQWQKEKGQKDKQLSTKHAHKTKTDTIWRYQRSNQNPYIEEQTTQWPKEKVQKNKQWSKIEMLFTMMVKSIGLMDPNPPLLLKWCGHARAFYMQVSTFKYVYSRNTNKHCRYRNLNCPSDIHWLNIYLFIVC